MNLKRLAYKLQKALQLKGRYIKINQRQFYSTDQERFCTRYTLTETVYRNGKAKDETLLETYKLIIVVQYLAGLLRGGE